MSSWTPLCCFVAIMHLFSKSLSIVLRCGGLLRHVIFSFSRARCIRWPGFAIIRLSCRFVIDVMLLHSVCCTRLMRTRIVVCSVRSHLLLSEFDMAVLRLQLIHSSLILKTLKTFIVTVCQYNTVQYNVICLQNVYNCFFFISKRLYIKTRGPNCRL